jgi:hypothetical protein
MRRVDRSAPIGMAVFCHDGPQIICHTPGIAHVCHGVEDQFCFTGHDFLQKKNKIPASARKD